MNKIIWIFGISGAGKKYFLKKISNNDFSESENRKLSLSDRCKPCYGSLNTKNARDEEEIIKEIKEIISNKFIPIVKYQEFDFRTKKGESNLFEKIKEMFPYHDQEIFFLFIDFSGWYKRVMTDRRRRPKLVKKIENSDDEGLSVWKKATEDTLAKILGFNNVYYFNSLKDYKKLKLEDIRNKLN